MFTYTVEPSSPDYQDMGPCTIPAPLLSKQLQ